MVNGYNAVKAYLAAYPGTSYESACSLASHLLRNIKIQAYVQYLKDNLEQTLGLSRARIAMEYMKLAFNSVADIHNTWVTRKELSELTPDQRSCISDIESKIIKKYDPETEQYYQIEQVKVKFYSKVSALRDLTKFFGYAEPEKVEASLQHYHKVEQIPTDKLSPQAKQLLLEISQQQLSERIIEN